MEMGGPSDCDSTVRQWGRPLPPPARKRGRTLLMRSGADAEVGSDVPWEDLPENALWTIFAALLRDKQGTQAVSSPCIMISMPSRTTCGGWGD